ncbi:MAG TPA: Fe-S cluster assembly protein SufB [Candidatus Absconditabacterales bacterium]|nr:Fe-S cluster assembly protein SufB [Candidatus Absconditabacterales bacterium]
MNLKQTLETPNKIKYDVYLKELSEDTVRKISADQKEPKWMLELRLKSLEIYNNTPMPNWGPNLKGLDLNDIVRYARPSSDNTGYATDRDDVPQEIKDKFDRLGIPEAEKKYLAGAGGQMDSVNFYHKIKEKRAKQGVIFEDMPTALQTHEELIKKYFMKLVPPTDHKFAALHGAVRSGGTFIYIPKGIKADEPLQAYFRMNTYAGGQFEHTLIIVDDDAECNYIEGCSAPKYDKSSIHAGLVEIFVGKNSTMRYSSVENWSTNTYNLNTKRVLVEKNSYMEWVSGNLGSQTTMLYPCSILKGDNSKTDLLGIVMATKDQNQDVGSKVVHIGKNTKSNIVSKSISKDGGISTYRGIVSIAKSAENSISNTECDAMLIDDKSTNITIPNIVDNSDSSSISHEAYTGKMDEEKLFYLTSRGITLDKATSMIVNGFFSKITKKLPLEYAGELNTLIEMEMEGSIG